jgi:hypothetical protein
MKCWHAHIHTNQPREASPSKSEKVNRVEGTEVEEEDDGNNDDDCKFCALFVLSINGKQSPCFKHQEHSNELIETLQLEV